MHSSTSGDDLVANDYRDPDFHFNISTGAGDDYIWTNTRSDLSMNGALTYNIDGGSGFDIFKIPDGWLGNFKVTPTSDGWIVDHGQGNEIFNVTGIELLILATASGTVEYFRDPYFDDGNNFVDFNNLTDIQTGLFNGIGRWYVYNWTYSDWQKFWPFSLNSSAYESGAGDDIVYLPNGANYVIHDNGYNPADVIWDYARFFNAGSGIDTVYGGDYHDKIDGGLGKDLLYGGTGNDTFRDSPFTDSGNGFGGYVDGGAGNDTFEFIYGSPTRIVKPDGAVVWSQGGPTSFNTTEVRLYAEWLDAAGGLVGWIEIRNVENFTNLISTAPPTERLFNDYANFVNFTALGAHEKAAINKLQSQGNIADMYVALGGDDVVTLPAHNALLGDTARWDANLTFKASGGDDIVNGSNGADKIDGGMGHDRLNGNGGADLLLGDHGDDRLDGGAGVDDMQGGQGDDTYLVDDPGDITTETVAAGIDTVESTAATFTLNPYFENLTLIGAGHLTGIGNGIANELTGNSGNNLLRGMDGDDILKGGGGEDRFEGGTGNDTYYVDSYGDVVVDGAGDAGDTVHSTISFVLPEYLENLHLQGDASIFGVGNDAANSIFGNSGSNFLDGRGGIDRMEGRGGSDTYGVDDVSDQVVEGENGGTDTVQSSVDYTLGSNLEWLLLTGDLNVNGTGNALDNIIRGNGGANVLDGAAGADFLAGGGGNDTYILDNLGDQVKETSAADGEDLVKTPFSYRLGAFLENLTLTGNDAINGFGNELGNIIIGNAANNVLDGGSGADRMEGGAGDDVYVVDDAGDVADETSGAGLRDIVLSSVSFQLGDFLEVLRLTGTAAINGYGNGQDNELYGNDAANVLFGGAGADRMVGGGGNDTYFVDHMFDVVIEAPGGGEDMVQSWTSYALTANVEHLVLLGFANVFGTGNILDNVIYGNGGANVIDGRLGTDKMYGERGDDIYIVDNVGDRVFETSAIGGDDLVQSFVTFTLGANLERLQLLGAADIRGFGNELNNTLTGNGGANLLDGLAGADRMTGGAGDDSYFVDNAGDRVIETSMTGGYDVVRSKVNFTLGANVEELRLIDAGNVNGYGNSLDNLIGGNAGNNVLVGLGGDDSLVGGAGDDALWGGFGIDEIRGGSGRDRFMFDQAHPSDADHILDFSSVDDAIFLSRSAFTGLSGDGFPAGAFVIGTTAQDLDDRIIYDSASGNLYYDSDGTGGVGQTLFATVTPGTVIHAWDFALFG